MKTSLIFSITILLSFCGVAQTIASFGVDSGGLIVTNSDIKMIYTIGEVNVQESTIGNIFLSEGFINSNIASDILGVDDDNFLEDQISIFPNPATEIININSTLAIERVELFDTMGKEIIVAKESMQLKINYLSSGLYMLKIFTQYGYVTKKIIVE